jgi:hypothetical protein
MVFPTKKICPDTLQELRESVERDTHSQLMKKRVAFGCHVNTRKQILMHVQLVFVDFFYFLLPRAAMRGRKLNFHPCRAYLIFEAAVKTYDKSPANENMRGK